LNDFLIVVNSEIWGCCGDDSLFWVDYGWGVLEVILMGVLDGIQI
jgi:hypothetical protein